MQITMIGPVYPYRGGIAHYTTQLVSALLMAGHSVETISFKKQYPKWLYPGKTDKDPSNSQAEVRAKYILDPLNPYSWYRAAREIENKKNDLVVIQWWTTFWAPAFYCLSAALKRKKIKTIFLIHNVLPHEERKIDPWLAKLALSQGCSFVTQTKREEQRLLKLLPGRKVMISSLPRYAFTTDPNQTKESARIQLGLPLKRPIILFFGIIRPYKGLRFLLEAIPSIKAYYGAHTPLLLAVGEIWDNKLDYFELIKQLNIDDCVRLDNRYVPDEEAAMMFSASDLFVAPYVDGTQSAAAGLALGFGLPLVVTEVVASGISAEYKRFIRVVKPGSSEALAQAICEVLDDPNFQKPSPINIEKDWEDVITTLEELHDCSG